MSMSLSPQARKIQVEAKVNAPSTQTVGAVVKVHTYDRPACVGREPEQNSIHDPFTWKCQQGLKRIHPLD